MKCDIVKKYSESTAKKTQGDYKNSLQLQNLIDVKQEWQCSKKMFGWVLGEQIVRVWVQEVKEEKEEEEWYNDLIEGKRSTAEWKWPDNIDEACSKCMMILATMTIDTKWFVTSFLLCRMSLLTKCLGTK